MSIEVRVIQSRAEFAALAEPWNELICRATLKNIFYRHEWFDCWLDQIAPTARLRIVTLAHQGRFVAAAPLQVVTVRRQGLPIETLSFLQSGVTPRSGLLVEHDDLCGPLIAAIDSVRGWSLAEFKSMELDHRTTRSFADRLRLRGAVIAEVGMISPFEELPDSWDAYYQSRTYKMRQRFRSAVNRINKNDTVEVLRLESYAELERHFDSLLAISAASWKGVEGTDISTVSQMAGFYRAYSRRTEEQGAWVVYLLKLDGKPAAFMYLLRDGSYWVALRSDYDEAYSYFMPGVYLYKEVISDLTTLPDPRVLDLVGWATTFKSGLARTPRPLCDLTFAPRNLGGRVLMWGKAMLGKRPGRQYLDLRQVIAGTVVPLNAGDDDESAQEPSPKQE